MMFEHIKKGDVVRVVNGKSSHSAKVLKVTDKAIETYGGLYSRITGKQLGRGNSGFIRAATPEERIQSLYEQAQMKTLAAGLTPEQSNEIVNLLLDQIKELTDIAKAAATPELYSNACHVAAYTINKAAIVRKQSPFFVTDETMTRAVDIISEAVGVSLAGFEKRGNP